MLDKGTVFHLRLNFWNEHVPGCWGREGYLVGTSRCIRASQGTFSSYYIYRFFHKHLNDIKSESLYNICLYDPICFFCSPWEFPTLHSFIFYFYFVSGLTKKTVSSSPLENKTKKELFQKKDECLFTPKMNTIAVTFVGKLSTLMRNYIQDILLQMWNKPTD